MTLRVVGAGVGRTGTTSLKIALEQLLGGRCYHMIETFGKPDHRLAWQEAFEGRPPDWSTFFEGYLATVDWPGAGAWRELHEAFPDALVLLSVRDIDAWWASASKTIFVAMTKVDRGEDEPTPLDRMNDAMMARFTPDFIDEAAAKAAYLAHNDEVRATVPAGQLLEWQAGDGWEPLCAALGVPVPTEPFPHANTTEQFRMMLGLDGSPD